MTRDLPALSGDGIAAKAIEVAGLVAGKAYRWNGKDLEGFDCSGFVAWVLGELMPQARDQFRLNTAGFATSALFEDVAAADRQPGDLIQFAASSQGVAHIGIVIDGEHWMGSQSSTGVAKVRFTNPWWSKRTATFRRLKIVSARSLHASLGRHALRA
jgi:peptidoglycan DL-endopeptidase LytE